MIKKIHGLAVAYSVSFGAGCPSLSPTPPSAFILLPMTLAR
jgi:hypothetical protein